MPRKSKEPMHGPRGRRKNGGGGGWATGYATGNRREDFELFVVGGDLAEFESNQENFGRGSGTGQPSRGARGGRGRASHGRGGRGRSSMPSDRGGRGGRSPFSAIGYAYGGEEEGREEEGEEEIGEERRESILNVFVERRPGQVSELESIMLKNCEDAEQTTGLGFRRELEEEDLVIGGVRVRTEEGQQGFGGVSLTMGERERGKWKTSGGNVGEVEGMKMEDESDDEDADDAGGFSSSIDAEIAEDFVLNGEGSEGEMDTSWLLRRGLLETHIADIESEGSSEEDEDCVDEELLGSPSSSLSSSEESDEAEESEEEVDGGEGEMETSFSNLQVSRELQALIAETQGAGLVSWPSGGKLQPVIETQGAGLVSWPVGGQKKPKDKGGKKGPLPPGVKKARRRERIETKRAQRAAKQGFQYMAFHEAIEDMVKREVDMLAFPPMEDGHRKIVHQIAAKYRLKSGSQGSGKRRFVVLTRTEHTCAPQGADLIRLLLDLERGMPDDLGDAERAPKKFDDRFVVNGELNRMGRKVRRAAREANRLMKLEIANPSGIDYSEGFGNLRGKSINYSEGLGNQRGKRKGKGKQHEAMGGTRQSKAELRRAKKTAGLKGGGKEQGQGRVSYAKQPVGFVSSGVVTAEAYMEVGTTAGVEEGNRDRAHGRGNAYQGTSDGAFGQFEEHTRGFGSRMLSRMGFVQGSGLGREGQGMVAPVVPVKRPKSLGLGA